MKHARLKIVLLEDKSAMARQIVRALHGLEHEVCGVAGAVAGLARLLENHRPDLVIIALDLGERKDGVGVATALGAAGPMPVVFASAVAGEEQREEIKAVECSSLLLRPFTRPAVRMAIALAVARTREALEFSAG